MPTRLGRTPLGESFYDKKARTEESPLETQRLDGESRGESFLGKIDSKSQELFLKNSHQPKQIGKSTEIEGASY